MSNLIEKLYISNILQQVSNKLSLSSEDDILDFKPITPKDILGYDRSKSIVKARHLAIQLVRRFTDLSLNEIGHLFNKDHKSITHALKKPRTYEYYNLEVWFSSGRVI